MAVTLTAAAQAELKKYAPRIVTTAQIIKDYYATQTVYDVTDYIISFGILRLDSTLAQKDWNMPTLITKLDNSAVGNKGYFNPANSNSIWQLYPSKNPEACVFRVRQYIKTDSGTEKIFEYVGRIRKPKIRYSEKESLCELESIWEPGDKLKKYCTKRDGSWTNFDGSTVTYYDLGSGSNIMPHPTINTWTGWDGSQPFPKYRAYVSPLCNAFLVDMRNLVTGEIETVQTWAALAGITTIANTQIASAKPYTLGASTYHIRYHIPPAWHQDNPGIIIKEAIEKAAGVHYSFSDTSGWTSLAIYFSDASLSPHYYLLNAACYDKTYLEFVLEILGYCPQIFLNITNMSVIKAQLMNLLSSMTSQITFSEDEHNYIELDEDDVDVERLATTIELFYGANLTQGITETINGLTHWSNWFMDRQISVGGNRGQGARTDQNRNHYSVVKTTGTSVDRTEKLDVDMPWFPPSSGGYVLPNLFCDSYFEMYDRPVRYGVLRAGHEACFIENGDCVTLNIPSSFYDSQKMLITGKEYNIDTMESLFLLKKLEWERP